MPGFSIPPVFCSVSLLFSLAAQPELAGVHWIPSTGRHCTLGHQCPAARRCILGNLGSCRFLLITTCTMFIILIHNCLVVVFTADLTTCLRDWRIVILTCLPTVHCCSMVHSAARAGSQCPPVREIWHMSSGQSEENISDREISVCYWGVMPWQALERGLDIESSAVRADMM